MQQMAATTTESPPPRDDFRITARVLAWLAAVARFGVLTSLQIARLDGGSRQNVVRGLQKCVEHKLLRRVDTTPEPLFSGFFDARPRTYCITQKGLRSLAAAGISLNVTPKKANVLLAHEIETAEFLFSLSAAAAQHGVQLIDQPELIATMPAATRSLKKPLRLSAKADPRDFPHLRPILKHATVIGTEPDRLVALRLSNGNGWSLAAELDRSTEDLHARRIQGRATWMRKALGYTASWMQGEHVAQWGNACRAFRVLVVTTNETRIKHMIEIQDYIGAPPGLFLYSTQQRLLERGALGNAWITAKRDDVSLLDRD